MPSAMKGMLEKVSESIASHRKLIDAKHPSKDDITDLKKDLESAVQKQTEAVIEILHTKVQAQDKRIDRLEQRLDDMNREIIAIIKSA